MRFFQKKRSKKTLTRQGERLLKTNHENKLVEN